MKQPKLPNHTTQEILDELHKRGVEAKVKLTGDSSLHRSLRMSKVRTKLKPHNPNKHGIQRQKHK